MKEYISTIMMSLFIFVAVVVTVGIAQAHDHERKSVEVIITNITKGQIITPPVIISHNSHFSLFTLGVLGAPASPGVIELAEDGVTTGLISEISTHPAVFDYTESTVPLMPGESVTLSVNAQHRYGQISAIGMLAGTNDAFVAVRGAGISKRGEKTVFGLAYDAGSEINSESCDYIPGPPCNHPFVRDTVGAEGFVHVHSGIHGIGDLDPETYDWHNPVAEITIKRVHD